MPTLLENVTQELTSYVSILVAVISSVFHAVTFVGKIICDLCYVTFSFILYVFSNISTGYAIFVTEFGLFVSDILATFYEINHIFYVGFQSFLTVLEDLLCSFQAQIFYILSELYSTILSLGDLAVFAVKTFKEAVILVGDGSLFLVQLVPSTLFGIFSAIIFLIEGAVGGIYFLIYLIVWDSFKVATRICQELFDLPPSSLFGVLLAAAITAVLCAVIRSMHLRNYWTTIKNSLDMVLRRTPARSLNDSSFSLDGEPVAGTSTRKASTCTKSSLMKELEQEREGKLCVVCQDRNKCIILLPCRHFCLCDSCMDTLAQTYMYNPTCPICRHEVINHLRVYG